MRHFFKESNETFKCIEAHVKRRLLEADSMVFSNRDDVDRAIASFADKFIFHNFFDKAELLKRAYEKYMAISKSDLISRLNVVKFLMCMSHSPTKKFEEAIEESVVEDEDEISDWGAFLKEGIEKWVPESDSEDSVSVLISSRKRFVLIFFFFRNGVQILYAHHQHNNNLTKTPNNPHI